MNTALGLFFSFSSASLSELAALIPAGSDGGPTITKSFFNEGPAVHAEARVLCWHLRGRPAKLSASRRKSPEDDILVCAGNTTLAAG
jgi:hypothetical protein